MTQEEFYALAENPPAYDLGPTVFVVKPYVVDEENDVLSHNSSYYIYDEFPSYCSTLADAERLAKEIAKHCRKRNQSIYVINVSEFALNERQRHYCPMSRRIYNADGQLIDRSLCCSFPRPTEAQEPFNVYRGRPESLLRFKPGDIVEVVNQYDKDQVTLAVVTVAPMTVSHCWKMYSERGVNMESFDDRYVVVDGPGGYEHHLHIPFYEVYAPHFSIPDKTRQELNSYYAEAIADSEHKYYQEYR